MRLFTSTILCASFSLLLTGASSAVVVWFSGINIPIPATFDGVFVDLETGNTSTTEFPQADANFFFSGAVIGNDATGLPAPPAVPTWQPVRIASTDGATIANLPLGTPIGPGSPMGSSFGGSGNHIGTQFTAGDPGYIGFSLNHDTLGLVYGWALVTLDVPANTGLITTYVFQDNGNPIPAGIPEPTAPLLAALGLGFLAVRRRRR